MVSVYEFGGMNAFWVDGISEYVLAMPGPVDRTAEAARGVMPSRARLVEVVVGCLNYRANYVITGLALLVILPC